MSDTPNPNDLSDIPLDADRPTALDDLLDQDAADPMAALAAERDQHWARVGAASFLTDAEKRAALGLPPLGLTARGEG